MLKLKHLSNRGVYRPIFIAILLFYIFGFIVSGPALAFDLQKGADDSLDLLKKILLIVIIAVAIKLFVSHQLVAAVVLVFVAAMVLAVTSPGLLELIGKSIFEILGG